MDETSLRQLLEAIRGGEQTVDQAIERMRRMPFEDLGFAKLDHHRMIRCGFPEVVYAQGKTVDQLVAIMDRCVDSGINVLATRATRSAFDAVAARQPLAEYHDAARAITIRQRDPVYHEGTIAVVSAGTSDSPVAEEARVTAEMMDHRTETIYDVGVAGLHRLVAYMEQLSAAAVIIVVAGMDGALPSVVGGLVDRPVIAVPTSTGYGASFSGLSALLTMLNSCAAGVTVVNIDNGFGAGAAAARIVRLLGHAGGSTP